MGDAPEYSTAVSLTRGCRTKRKARNELQELRKENKQLRETVAHLSELVLNEIAGPPSPKSGVLVPNIYRGSTTGRRIAGAIRKLFVRAESRNDIK